MKSREIYATGSDLYIGKEIRHRECRKNQKAPRKRFLMKIR
jgi:hypothetical protein